MSKKKNRKKRVKPVLPRRSTAHQELVRKLRFGNAAQPQTLKHRKGTRGARENDAIDDQL